MSSHEQEPDTGKAISERYFFQVVAPMLDVHLPDMPYAAGLIGDGSEVLGFDTPRSRDHDWGPRVQLFFDRTQFEFVNNVLPNILAAHLPPQFELLTTQYHRGEPTQPSGPWRLGMIHRGVELHDLGDWSQKLFGVHDCERLTIRDWLTIPWNILCGVQEGVIWHDDNVGLQTLKDSLAWYPPDLWKYAVAAQWQRINQEEPFIHRTAEVGADLGSRLITARLCRDVMHLCFLLEMRYPPYMKWLDSAFQQLSCATDIRPLLLSALEAPTKTAREAAFVDAVIGVAKLHNHVGLSRAVDPNIQLFFDRPYQVMNSYRFVEATLEAIEDPDIRVFPLCGTISQWADATDVLTSHKTARWITGFLSQHEPI